LASLHIYSLESNSVIDITSNSTRKSIDYTELNDDDRLITEVLWATESHSHLLFKQTNRVQDIEITSLVTIGSNDTHVEHVRTYKPDDGGWIESLQTMVYMPKNDTSAIQYLDVIDNDDGFLHLALLSTYTKPVWLTTGEWEVIPGTVIVDQKRQLVHYSSTEQSSLERHLYKLDLTSGTKECITCHGRGFNYAVSISPHLGYYVLQYDGPEIPTTTVRQVDNSTFETVLQDNTSLQTLLKNYALPKTRMVSVNSGGVAMNAMEIVPPDFDATKKYPVLFHVYGGPGSQLVSYRYELSWSTYLAGKLGYIVVTVTFTSHFYKKKKKKLILHRWMVEVLALEEESIGRLYEED
jgi:dipeptidyl aminopeptidase